MSLDSSHQSDEKMRITIDLNRNLVSQAINDLAPFMADHADVIKVHIEETPKHSLNPELFLWTEGDGSEEPLPMVTVGMLADFSLKKRGNTRAGNGLGRCLSSSNYKPLSLEPYLIFAPNSSHPVGFRADQLDLLCERLRLPSVHVYHLGENSISLAEEYCQLLYADIPVR